mgnify:CR=1 FL=1
MRRFSNYTTSIAILSLALAMVTSCDKFLDITPTGKVIAHTGEEFRALLTYEYKYIPEDRGLASFRSDEFQFDRSSTSSEDYASFFDIWSWNDTAQQSTTTQFGWRRYYHAIYISNYIIEHQNEITDATKNEISQLVGESYMMRAYMHFLLVNLYADAYTACNPQNTRGIPLQLKADVKTVPSCSSIDSVYQSILSDIDSAIQNMNVSSWDLGLNYRFSIRSAKAIRARVLLYMGNWKDALAQSAEVLEEYGTLVDLTQKNAVIPCRYDSPENILALEQVMTNLYKGAGQPSKELVKSYRDGDGRKSNYYKQITSSSTTLLKGGSNEFCCSIRTAELYLIAAESALETGDTARSVSYLCSLLQMRYSEKAWKGDKNKEGYESEIRRMSVQELRNTIYEERRKELAFEGLRWFDLRRCGRPELTKTYQNESFTLYNKDSRYTIGFPPEVIQANPGLTKWNQ